MYLSLKIPTPTEKIVFDGVTFYLKRDDLIHPDFSGNKARKFHYYLSHDFPKVKKIVSYGSNQSNAMYSLSVLAKMKGWTFEYDADHIPDYLRENPQGNYRRALENGMKMRIQDSGFRIQEEEVLWIEEGGRQEEAEFGIRILAEEIIDWQEKEEIGHLNIFLPSGTGTTALYLRKSLLTLSPSCFTSNIFTTPCVGDSDYLKKQFLMLEENEKYHPTILNLQKKYHFGKLYKDYYKIWLKLRQQTGVEFDLLYDPKGWMTVMAYSEKFLEPTLYIHQGGLIGNESMLPRYERKYPSISTEDIPFVY